jgi:hypothetical protein
MIQASLVAYGTGGTFLGLAYFDLAYHLVAAIVIAKTIVLRAEQEIQVGSAAGMWASTVAKSTTAGSAVVRQAPLLGGAGDGT